MTKKFPLIKSTEPTVADDALSVSDIWVDISSAPAIKKCTSIDPVTFQAASGGTPNAHAASHTDATDDIQSATSSVKGVATAAQITKLDGIATGADVTGSNAPQAHAASHENAGGDEISVAGLSGLLADDQHVLDAEVVAAVIAGNFVPRTYVWFVKGTVAVGTEQGATFRMKRATTVEDVELHVKTAPTGAALIVDINEAGTTLFATKPEIDISGTTEDNNHAFSDTALAAAAELTMDVDQVGSTVAGADLTVLLHVKEAVI